MASTKSTSSTTENSSTSSNSSTAENSSSSTSSSTVGGSHSTTQSHTNYGSDTTSSSSTTGGSNTTSYGKSAYTGTVKDSVEANLNDIIDNGYQQSDYVKSTYDKLLAAESGKPEYESKYQDALQSMYEKLMNYDDFSYNYNEDPIWQALNSTYTQQGKQAMEDTMGQAATLTGGYANSYAQTAGQQTYQNYLQNAIDEIPTLREEARQDYEDKLARLQDNFNLTNTMEESDYNRYRNDVTDWQSDRAYAQSAYQYADQSDYNKWSTWANLMQNEYWNEKQSETSNIQQTDETNYSNTTSESHTTGWEDTTSTTDSSYWSNTNSNTTSSALSNTVSNSVSNASSLTNSGSTTLSTASSGVSSGNTSKTGNNNNTSYSTISQPYQSGSTTENMVDTEQTLSQMAYYNTQAQREVIQDKMDDLSTDEEKAAYIMSLADQHKISQSEEDYFLNQLYKG